MCPCILSAQTRKRPNSPVDSFTLSFLPPIKENAVFAPLRAPVAGCVFHGGEVPPGAPALGSPPATGKISRSEPCCLLPHWMPSSGTCCRWGSTKMWRPAACAGPVSAVKRKAFALPGWVVFRCPASPAGGRCGWPGFDGFDFTARARPLQGGQRTVYKAYKGLYVFEKSGKVHPFLTAKCPCGGRFRVFCSVACHILWPIACHILWSIMSYFVVDMSYFVAIR